MRVNVTKSLEEILDLKENPVPIQKLAGKFLLMFTPYWGDIIINKLRKRMIADLTDEHACQGKPVNPKSIGDYANLISGALWLGKYYIYLDIGYDLCNHLYLSFMK